MYAVNNENSRDTESSCQSRDLAIASTPSWSVAVCSGPPAQERHRAVGVGPEGRPWRFTESWSTSATQTGWELGVFNLEERRLQGELIVALQSLEDSLLESLVTEQGVTDLKMGNLGQMWGRSLFRGCWGPGTAAQRSWGCPWRCSRRGAASLWLGLGLGGLKVPSSPNHAVVLWSTNRIYYCTVTTFSSENPVLNVTFVKQRDPKRTLIHSEMQVRLSKHAVEFNCLNLISYFTL